MHLVSAIDALCARDQAGQLFSRSIAMSIVRRELLRLSAAAALVVALPRSAWSQSYPIRPVRVIVPFAPGGPIDIAGRLIAQRLSQHFRMPFVVENIGGAGGNIGVGQAAK